MVSGDGVNYRRQIITWLDLLSGQIITCLDLLSEHIYVFQNGPERGYHYYDHHAITSRNLHMESVWMALHGKGLIVKRPV